MPLKPTSPLGRAGDLPWSFRGFPPNSVRPLEWRRADSSAFRRGFTRDPSKLLEGESVFNIPGATISLDLDVTVHADSTSHCYPGSTDLHHYEIEPAHFPSPKAKPMKSHGFASSD